MLKHGATPAFKMDNIKDFFKSRQKSGSSSVHQTNNHWTLFSREYIANLTRTWLCQGWPVVVGTTEGSFLKWHDPVATQLKSSSRNVRKCLSLGQETMFVLAQGVGLFDVPSHQGSSRTKTKWRRMSLHYAAITLY